MSFMLKRLDLECIRASIKNPLGAHFITSIDEELVINMTRWHLKALQDGTLNDDSHVVNTGIVGGKL